MLAEYTKLNATDNVMKEEKKVLETVDGVFNNVSWLFEDIKVMHNISAFNRQGRILTSREDDLVRLHFGLKGNYCFNYRQLNSTFDLVGGHHNLMFSDGFDIEVLNKTPAIETFGVQFSRQSFLALTEDGDETLKRFSDAVARGRGALLSQHWGAVNANIENIIRQVTQCKYDGRMQQIFVLSKCLELLVLSADCFSKYANPRISCLKNRDKERVIAARDMINARLESPPSLSEIARAVGLNEFKLKKGFREVFQVTVFGFLAERRLLLARQYLCDTDKTAAEIAYLMGYASPQHFNNAFKKHFGQTPSSVRKDF